MGYGNPDALKAELFFLINTPVIPNSEAWHASSLDCAYQLHGLATPVGTFDVPAGLSGDLAAAGLREAESDDD
jgi:hypothetical protein